MTFKKIQLNFTELDINYLKGEGLYSNAPVFYEYQIKNKIYLYQFLKNKIFFKIKPNFVDLIEIHSPGVKPHTDKWSVSLNCYINSSKDVTVIWEQKSVDSLIEKTAEGIKRFYQKDLSIKDSFSANSGDCILLDTHQIHSVNIQNEKRTILRFLWLDQNFENILNSIDIFN